jgi:hypothetical protein
VSAIDITATSRAVRDATLKGSTRYSFTIGRCRLTP